MKTFEIDFGGNVLAHLIIVDGKPHVMKAMNGWGNYIEISDINIKEVEVEPNVKTSGL